jgi:hypothetical protein
MENKNLSDLYAARYLSGPNTVVESTQADEQTLLEEKKKEVVKKKAKKEKEVDPGILGDSTGFNSIFGDILKSINEEFDMGDTGGDDTFDAEGDEGFEEDEQISVSKSVLQSIIDQLQGLVGDVGFDDGLDGDLSGEDDIPLESYGFDGAGQHVGGAADYSGKAKLLPNTDLVDGNGNIKKDKAKVAGTRPTKGHNGEGQHHGAQGNYDGKAKKQSASTHVKANGDADFGKNKTGYGRAKGEDLY